MSLNRRIGLGFTLGVDPAGGTSYTALGAIVDGWDEAPAKADVADISILADKYKAKSKSQIDPGEVTFEIAYDPDEASTTTCISMLQNMTQSTIPAWQISYPSGTLGGGTQTTDVFQGHMTGLGRTVQKGKLVVGKITITKTGQPGFHGD